MDTQRILDRIGSPAELRSLSTDQLNGLAEEIRETVIQMVSRHGGHLASNLGVAELTIALHYVFDFAKDKLLWDVGHQCYPHKLLTGRADKFHTLRQAGGLSGFPSPAESPYDLFYTGHAGTALSTAAGLAWARRQCSKCKEKIVAVVGDAGIVNGLSFEALNNIAAIEGQLLIVLNDNSMAIDTTRGALARAFDRIRMNPRYGDLKQSVENVLQRIPMGDDISEAIKHFKYGLKSTLQGGHIFEALGIGYFGPVDGHNVSSLIKAFKALSEIDQPVLLHVHTQKGHGCRYAVEDPCRFHSPAAYEHHGDRAVIKPRKQLTWTEAFATSIVELAKTDDRIVAITAAMPDGTGLAKFRQAFGQRYIDVGMNESHAVAMAAGLAKGGLKPVVAIYSTFMQRAFDQVFEEVSLQHLPVVFCMDRAGLVGSDGAVHHGFADIAYMRPLPGMVLMAPADAAELTASLKSALELQCPVAIRYPRDEIGVELPGPCLPFQVGRARTVRQGDDAAILAYGAMTEPALAAADVLSEQAGLNVAVANARFAKPLDENLITRWVTSRKPLLVCEDHAVIGGIGSAIMELAANRRWDASNVQLAGIPDKFIAHASRHHQISEAGLDAASLARRVMSMVTQGKGTYHPNQTAGKVIL